MQYRLASKLLILVLQKQNRFIIACTTNPLELKRLFCNSFFALKIIVNHMMKVIASN